MANDPNNFGLGELGQRVQALGDPAPEPRLRPYQGGSTPSAVPAPQKPAPPPPASSYGAWPSAFTAPAAPEPFTEVPAYGSSGNGYSNPSGAPSASAPPSQAPSQPPPAAAPDDPNAPKSGIQRAINAVRSTLPLVQRLLPLLEGNLATAATAITAIVAAQPPRHTPAPPPPVQVDLEPVERGLAEVRTSNRELRNQFAEQATTLKRVEDQLDRVREATDRNTLEQQELVEDLRAVGSRVSTLAIVGLVILVVSLLLNGYLIFQLQHILH
jgi:hypothetical protein